MSVVPVAPQSSDAEARLALRDCLLGDDDAISAAQHAIDWLGARASVGPLLCAGVDRGRGLLVGLAGSACRCPSVAEEVKDLARPGLGRLGHWPKARGVS